MSSILFILDSKAPLQWMPEGRERNAMQTKSLVLPVISSYWLVASDLGDIATNCTHQTGMLSMF